MARQKGIIKLKGTIGDITFYKSKDGYLAREKGGVDGERIANDANFQRTRENGAEFGKAAKSAKLLRIALRSFVQNASDSKMVGRLTKEMLKVIQADAVNPRGQRNVIDGEAELLQGFEFNLNGKLGNTFFAPFTTEIDRVTGELEIEIPSYVSNQMIAYPKGATHYKIVSAGLEIDFENGVYIVDSQSSTTLQLQAFATSMLTLTNQVTANSTHPLFLVLGVEFYQEVNGEMYSLKNGAYNSLGIVRVSGL